MTSTSMASPKQCVVLSLMFCLAVCAKASAQYRFDTWTTDNGLPQNGVRQITQTPDGYLWFTTFDGLVRFDGVRFTTFGTGNTKGIINNRFTGLYRDKDGTLYATTMEDGVLTVYRDGVFSSYNSDQVPGHYIQQITPDARGELRFLVEDEERTSKSWYHLRDGKFVFSAIENPDPVQTVVARSGAVWRITTKEAVERRGDKTTVYPLNIGNLTFRLNTFEDSAGNLWLGEYAVHRLGGGKIQRFGEADGLLPSIHHSFWEEPDGSVWFAGGGGSTQGEGLIQYQQGKLRTWGVESGLLSTTIFSVFRDREGTTWLATNKGLSRLRKQVLSSFSTKDGINHSEVYPLYRDHEERIWIGTTKGLSIYEHGKFAALDLKPANRNAPVDELWRGSEMSVQSLWEDANGRMWVGLDGGIYLVEHGAARMLEGARGDHVFAIRGDRNGNVWAASNKGISHYRDTRLIGRLSVKDGLPNEFMTTIFEDSKGNLWFGGLGGLSRFADGKFFNYTVKDGLAGNYVRSIYEDAAGTLWIGTYNEGLSRFKDGRFVNYKTENGLYNNGVFAIEEDARGNFWISSNHGIYRVKRQELNDFADGKIAKINSVGYGTLDGMLSTECNGGRQPASVKDQNGRFWFPTQDGVVVIEPENETYNTLPPSVVIESATVEREAVDIRRGLTVGPGQKNIEINFAGISLIKSDQVEYRYKLEGHDADWVDAATRRTAYYSYLPPGTYRFVVKAANSDNIWNEKGASLVLELRPFFYQRRLFYVASALGAALVLLGAWKISVQRFAARERQLAKLVDEKTEALREANEELQHLAHSDGLTAVGNRRLFEEFLRREWRRAIRFKTPVSLILLDIDHFKQFNDTYGHHAGDECLKNVAAALRETIHRPTDLLARYGGEEFAIVLGGTDSAGAFTIAEHAVQKVRSLTQVTISAGVATTRVAVGMSEADLIKAADEALYRAKAGGRDRIASSASERV
jgi:diguanylate cyclase (GGDEF)-like protein